MRALAWTVLRDRSAMDDALQDAYLQAYRNLDRFRGESRFSTWLHQIVYRACLDQVRRRRPVDPLPEIDPAATGRAQGEVDGALRALGVGGDGVSVISCDVEVGETQRVRHGRDVRFTGGGGTDLRVGISAASQLRPRPDLVVVFTDGHTPWPHSPPPGSAVVVALLGRDRSHLPPTPEWATRVECLLD